MLPSILAKQLQKGIGDYIETTFPMTNAVSEAESITSEKCLLYVAMTRAQKGVYITSYGRKSEFLE